MSDKRDELLDHEVDGIRELDNALPRWWLYGFYFTIVFGVAYFVNYHALPTPFFGKSTLAAEHAADVAAAEALRPKPAASTAAIALRKDDASLSRGKEIFEGQTNACHACHRADLGGLIGPNLTDDFWLHGCGPADIAKSITTGYPDKGMQPFGTTMRLTETQMADLVSYLVSKQGSTPAGAKPADAARDAACQAAATN